MDREFYFPGVTLLITHHNKSASLERLLSAFKKLQCRFDNIVVSDDASENEHLARVKDLQLHHNFRLVTAHKSNGLGACINMGQTAVDTSFTFYLQEDFVPTPKCPQNLQHALNMLITYPYFDYIRLWSKFRYPVLLPFYMGFSETVYNKWSMNPLKYLLYTNEPQLRRSNFFDRFGKYQEGIVSDESEYRMSISFIQKKGKGLFYEDYLTLFTCENEGKQDWKNLQPEGNLFVRLIYWFRLHYKWIKCTNDQPYTKA